MQSADFLSAVFFYLKVGENLNQNWIVENLNNAFSTWNGKLGELWGLVTTGPQTFKGGAVWSVMQTLHNGMVGIGYALVVLFFAISLCKNTMNFHELKRPEAAIHYFLRFVAAKALVGYGMDIMLNVFSICNGIVTDMADSMGGISEAMVSLPAEMQTAIENVGFLASIPLWLVTILGSLFITVLSFVMILTVYGRFFRLYMYTALAPLPLAAFAGESTQSVGISFLKSYVGVCLEGAVIVLACVIYSAFVSTPTVTSGEATTIVWSYLAETVFNIHAACGATCAGRVHAACGTARAGRIHTACGTARAGRIHAACGAARAGRVHAACGTARAGRIHAACGAACAGRVHAAYRCTACRQFPHHARDGPSRDRRSQKVDTHRRHCLSCDYCRCAWRCSARRQGQ